MWNTLNKLLFLRHRVFNCTSRFLNKYPQLFRKQMKLKQDHCKIEIKDTEVQASSYTPLQCMTSARNIIQHFPVNSSVNLHSRQSGECDVHEPETSRPSQANARHFQVGCKHCIYMCHLILSNHIICFQQRVRCIIVLFVTSFIILKFL